jgi:hypothetical protein
MPAHKFEVGETVMLMAAASRNVPGGVYEVTKQPPHNGREFAIASRAQTKNTSELREKASSRKL